MKLGIEILIKLNYNNIKRLGKGDLRMDKMKVFGIVPYSKNNERDGIIKKLKLEFGREVKISINMDHIAYNTYIKGSEIVV